MSRKITEHEEMLPAAIDGDDMLEIVDISDSSDAPSGTNKKLKWSDAEAKLQEHFDNVYSTFSGDYDDLSNKPTLGTAASQNSTAFATASQGAKADTAIQPGDLADVATTGSYNDLSDTPDLSNLPSAGEKQALVGSSGTPSNLNPYVTNADSRLTNARTPTSHAISHQSGGSDAIKLDDLAAPDDNTDLDATTSAHGLFPKADKVKLNGIEANADVTDAANVGSSIDGTTAKGSLVDNDEFAILDSAASNNLKTVLWSVIKTALNALYALKGLITGSGLTMGTGKLLGRSTASTGAIEEITVGSGLSLSGGTLSASGGGGGSGKLVDHLVYQDSGSSTTTAIIPTDGTIPQNTEGVEHGSVSFTPKAIGNILVVSVSGMYSRSTNGTISLALFQDSASNAISAQALYISAATTINLFSIKVSLTASGTSSTTFKLRHGPATSGTSYINRTSSTGFFGGIEFVTWEISEYAP